MVEDVSFRFPRWVNVPLDAADSARFDAVRSYYGIKAATEVVRLLIRQEARKLNLPETRAQVSEPN